MRKAATIRNTQITFSGKTPLELAFGRRPKDLLDPASMDPQAADDRTEQGGQNERGIAETCHENTPGSTAEGGHKARPGVALKICTSQLGSRGPCVLLVNRFLQDQAGQESR